MSEENKFSNNFSMRKIPVSNKQNQDIDDINFDKIKILELCNSIDKWEQEILFDEKGFYSVKGKDVKEKLPEFEKELEDFINVKISEVSFSDDFMKEKALEIKDNKLNAIKLQMKFYEQEQLQIWQTDIFEEALNCAVTRAVLYKSDDNIIQSSFNNALEVIEAMAQKENWNIKIKSDKIKKFKSKFYTELIQSFIQDKDIKASVFFDKYKDFLDEELKEKIQTAVNKLKTNVIAYNFAKELFSYKLSVSEQEKELDRIKDNDIKKYVRFFLSDFKSDEKKFNEQDLKNKNYQNWQTLMSLEEFDKAILYVDYTLDDESIKAKKSYIKQIKNSGLIITDKSKFVELFSEIFEDYEKFKQSDLSNNYCSLSKEDFDLIKGYQNITDNQFLILNSDYKYIKKKFNEINLKSDDDKYEFIKLVISSFEKYKETNKKEADIETRNKFIESVTSRFSK